MIYDAIRIGAPSHEPVRYDVKQPDRQRPIGLGFDKIPKMCGCYARAKEPEALSGYFGAEFSELHRPIYNASSVQCLPVILDAEPDRIQPALWGTWRQPGQTAPCRCFGRSQSNRTCLASQDHVRWSKVGKGPIAQRLEQRTHNPSVPGSNPGGPTRRPCLSRRPATTRTARRPSLSVDVKGPDHAIRGRLAACAEARPDSYIGERLKSSMWTSSR